MIHAAARLLAVAAVASLAASASAQGTAPADPPAAEAKPADGPVAAPAAPTGPLGSLAWLAGCWSGTVNKRDFREHWLPLRGEDVMIGASQTVQGGRMQDYEYLRLERRDDGVFYVASPARQKESAFRLGEVTTAESGTVYPFVNPQHDFPQRIEYRRATEGWLYVTVEGTTNGKERKVIYPMRRVDCETGEFIRR